MRTKGALLYAAFAAIVILLFAGCTQSPAQDIPPGAAGAEPGAHYDIYIDNKLSSTVPFGAPDVIILDQGDGRVNELTVTQSGAYMSYATCPTQDCVQQGELTPENADERALGSFIICLPHKVAIELILGEQE